MHRFDNGLVVPAKKVPLALPYRELRIYRGVTHQFASNNMFRGISTDWQFQAGDGTVWKTALWQDRREATQSGLADCYDRVLETTCVQQRDEGWRRLLEGATLTFGRVAIDLAQVTIDPYSSVPGIEVLEITVIKWKLNITASLQSRWAKEHQISAGAINAMPDVPLLWELLHALRARALEQKTSANPPHGPGPPSSLRIAAPG